ELLDRTVVQPAQIGVGHTGGQGRAHDRNIEVIGDAVEHGVVALEQRRRSGLVARVELGGLPAGAGRPGGGGARGGGSARGGGPPRRDRDVRDELQQVPHHHLRHGARGAENRNLHSSSSALMSGVEASTSLSVSSKASRTCSMSLSGML